MRRVWGATGDEDNGRITSHFSHGPSLGSFTGTVHGPCHRFQSSRGFYRSGPYRVVHDKSLLGLPLQRAFYYFFGLVITPTTMLINGDAAAATKPLSLQPAWWKDGIIIYEVRPMLRALLLESRPNEGLGLELNPLSAGVPRLVQG